MNAYSLDRAYRFVKLNRQRVIPSPPMCAHGYGSSAWQHPAGVGCVRASIERGTTR